MKDPVCECFPQTAPGISNGPCGQPASIFYVIWLKNDSGRKLFTARCDNHSRESQDGRLFDGMRIPRDEYLVAEVMES